MGWTLNVELAVVGVLHQQRVGWTLNVELRSSIGVLSGCAALDRCCRITALQAELKVAVVGVLHQQLGFAISCW